MLRSRRTRAHFRAAHQHALITVSLRAVLSARVVRLRIGERRRRPFRHARHESIPGANHHGDIPGLRNSNRPAGAADLQFALGFGVLAGAVFINVFAALEDAAVWRHGKSDPKGRDRMRARPPLNGGNLVRGSGAGENEGGAKRGGKQARFSHDDALHERCNNCRGGAGAIAAQLVAHLPQS